MGSTALPPGCSTAEELGELRTNIHALQRGLDSCLGDLHVLRVALADAGVLSHERFLVHRHRLHFEAMRAAHGLGLCDARLDVAVGVHDLAIAVGRFAGPLALEAVGAASRATAAAVRGANY